jgi:hypothetical protein
LVRVYILGDDTILVAITSYDAFIRAGGMYWLSTTGLNSGMFNSNIDAARNNPDKDIGFRALVMIGYGWM